MERLLLRHADPAPLLKYEALPPAGGLRRDLEAVKLSMTTPWSNGPIEGHINRLKAIKRQMYGRAGFELLKARVLPWDASSAA
jgi:hypothetical protein